MQKYISLSLFFIFSLSISLAQSQYDFETILTAEYAQEESSIIHTKHSTVICDFKVNGMSVLFPKSVIEDNRRGWINGTTNNYVPEGEFFTDYGENTLTIDAMAPIHYPRDGTYFFCEVDVLGENILINVSAKTDPLARSARSITQVITTRNDNTPKPEIDYNDVDWVIFKREGSDENLEIIYHEDKTFSDSILNDISVSTKFILEKGNTNLPSPIFWRDTKPFEETPENMALLWEAYEEILTAFESQKQSEVLKALEVAFIQSELVIGDPKEQYFTKSRLEKYQANWDEYGFKRDTEDKLENYELQIADHKKLFKLVLKKNNTFEPVRFSIPGSDDRYIIYNFYFSMIDGKPTVAFIERAVHIF